MAQDHDHGHATPAAGSEPGGHGGHSHDHTKGASARRLTIALSLTSIFLVAEVVAGFVFNSLALLSDAAHMFTDVVALAIALAAIKIGQRPADDKRTYGYRRFEILAAAFNAVLLFLVAGYVLFEGVKRILDPEPVASVGMLIVAALGLVINLISMRILSGGRDKSLNVKGAYLEVWADMIGSVGVLLGAGIIWLTGWRWVDPIIAILIGLWVLPRTWTLLKDTTHVLLEGVPSGLSLGDVRAALEQVPGVAGVHDLHLWGLSAEEANLTAHASLTEAADHEAVRREAARMLAERFAIRHSTLQTERDPCEPEGHLHR